MVYSHFQSDFDNFNLSSREWASWQSVSFDICMIDLLMYSICPITSIHHPLVTHLPRAYVVCVGFADFSGSFGARGDCNCIVRHCRPCVRSVYSFDSQDRMDCPGEIIPQAMCCRYGLVIGAYSAGFVMFLRRITFPISWPISKVLDWAIGANHTVLTTPMG